MHLSTQHSPTYHCSGLFATAPFLPGSTLGSIPLASVLTASSGLLACPDVARALLCLPSGSASPALAVLLCLAYSRGGSGPWAAYAASLPASVPSLLHCPSLTDAALASTLASLRLECLLPRLQAERAALAAGCAALAGAAAAAAAAPWATASALHWAHAAYASRCMRLPSGEPAMVPLFDMANHKQGSPVAFALTNSAGQQQAAPGAALLHPPPPSPHSLQALAALALHHSAAAAAQATTLPSCVFQPLLTSGSSSSSSSALPALLPPAPAPPSAHLALVLGSTKGLREGEEVTISYGAKSTLSFAMLFGFLPPQPNHADTLAVGISSSASSGLPVLALASSSHPAAFTLSYAGLPAGLLAACASALGLAATTTTTSSAAAGAEQGLASDPEVVGLLGAMGQAGVPVLQWLAGQCRAVAGQLQAARLAWEREERGGRAAAELALGISLAASSVLEGTARELLAAAAEFVGALQTL